MLGKILAAITAGRNLALAVINLFRSKRNAEEVQRRLDRMRERKKIDDEMDSQSDAERKRTARRFVRKRS